MQRKIFTALFILMLVFYSSLTIFANDIEGKIYLNPQGGIDGTSEVNINGSELPKIIPPVRRGYSFGGYFTGTNGNGEQYYDENGKALKDSSSLNSNILYAKWTIQSYSIIYSNIDGAIFDSEKPLVHNYGKPTSIPNPKKDGYTFFGWRVNDSAVSQQGLTLDSYKYTSDIELTAVWNRATLVSTVDTTAAKTVSMSSEHLSELFYMQVEDGKKGVTAFDLDSEKVRLVMTAADMDESAEGVSEIIDLAQGDKIKYYDFSVKKEVTKLGMQTVTTHLEELQRTVEISIKLSDDFCGAQGYRVYRFHNGKAEEVPVGPPYIDSPTKESYYLSEDGTSISLFTKSLSTYAIVVNSKTLNYEDETGNDMDVNARVIQENVSAIYRVDIKWGLMRFYYTTVAQWDPEKHSYLEEKKFEWAEHLSYSNGNNRVRVYNHSNSDIMVSMYVTDRAPEMDGVDMLIFTENEQTGTVAENQILQRVPAEGASAPCMDGYLRLSGTPDDLNSLKLSQEKSENNFARAANIAVTIAYQNSSLTPKG